MTTLMVIGVVAALTIPSMMQSHRERVTVTKVKQAYAILNQAYKMAVIEHGEFDDWEVEGKNWITPMKPYLKIEKDCTDKTENCTVPIYTDLKGTNTNFCNSDGNFNTSKCIGNKFFLNNNTILYVAATYKQDKKKIAYLAFDINGLKGPNKIGQDLFYFMIIENTVKPLSSYNGHSYTCEYNGDGSACALWIIEKGNMDYLHKEIS